MLVRANLSLLNSHLQILVAVLSSIEVFCSLPKLSRGIKTYYWDLISRRSYFENAALGIDIGHSKHDYTVPKWWSKRGTLRQ